MSDFLVKLGKSPTARRVVKTIGLPIPLPQELARPTEPWSEKPLEGKTALLSAEGPLGATLTESLNGAGATLVDTLEDGARAHAILIDASHLDSADALQAIHRYLQPRVRSVARCGRIVVFGRPLEGLAPEEAAAQAALDGFTRSVAKEVGRLGATANLIRVTPGAEDRVDPLLRWLLSEGGAFVSGQPITVSSTVANDSVAPTAQALVGKTALVTGAAQGIGKAIAGTLAREGAHVLCLDLPMHAEELDAVAEAVGGTALAGDVTDPTLAATVAKALEARGTSSLDILVNNAGVTRDKTLAKMSEGQWDLTLSVNLAAVIRLTRELPLAEGARVVGLSSINGLGGAFGQSNYAASKAGVAGFTRAVAPELAERGVAVNAVAPGYIETRMTAAVPVGTREAGRRLSALGQGGQPQDVAEVITFLASPGAAGLCGEVIRVCGGNFIGA